MDAIDLRKGMVVVEDGQLFTVVDRELNTPGNWRAILHVKLKNLKTGNTTVQRIHTDTRVEVAYLDKREMQYLYADGDRYIFMDNETYDQIFLGKEWIGDQIFYLRENDNAQVVLFENRPISLELPVKVELKVIATEKGLKASGSTSSASYKPATLETGLQLQVPPFVVEGDVISIDTRTGEYLGRVK